ncbi:hypothetical protein JOQ06_008645, partial [Pogonophryne albipinna]
MHVCETEMGPDEQSALTTLKREHLPSWSPKSSSLPVHSLTACLPKKYEDKHLNVLQPGLFCRRTGLQ